MLRIITRHVTSMLGTQRLRPISQLASLIVELQVSETGTRVVIWPSQSCICSSIPTSRHKHFFKMERAALKTFKFFFFFKFPKKTLKVLKAVFKKEKKIAQILRLYYLIPVFVQLNKKCYLKTKNHKGIFFTE